MKIIDVQCVKWQYIREAYILHTQGVGWWVIQIDLNELYSWSSNIQEGKLLISSHAFYVRQPWYVMWLVAGGKGWDNVTIHCIMWTKLEIQNITNK
jgi:hypothetical protein